jgi:hypothetical protein
MTDGGLHRVNAVTGSWVPFKSDEVVDVYVRPTVCESEVTESFLHLRRVQVKRGKVGNVDAVLVESVVDPVVEDFETEGLDQVPS